MKVNAKEKRTRESEIDEEIQSDKVSKRKKKK